MTRLRNLARLVQAAQGLAASAGELADAVERKAAARERRESSRLSDQAIRSLAVKAVHRFTDLPQQEAGHAWQVWKDEIRQELAANDADEVIRCAKRLWEALE